MELKLHLIMRLDVLSSVLPRIRLFCCISHLLYPQPLCSRVELAR